MIHIYIALQNTCTKTPETQYRRELQPILPLHENADYHNTGGYSGTSCIYSYIYTTKR